MHNFDHLLELYQSGALPWDQPEPPPEVLATVPALPVGRALDLGCGLGRASLYLASLGWTVDGVDFIPQAVTEAVARARKSGLGDRACFYQGSVTRLDFLSGPYDFALDVGCAHTLSLEELSTYHDELLRLLKPAAVYLLFAHLDDPDAEPEEQRWLDETSLRQIFTGGFTLERVEYGQTQVNDQPPWRSAWFWFRRSHGS